MRQRMAYRHTRLSRTHRAHSLTELLALEGVGDGLVEGALCETDHLSGDTDAALVEDLDGVPIGVQLVKSHREGNGGDPDSLVTLTFFAEEVLGGNAHAIEVERARRRSLDAQLLLLLHDLHAHRLLGDEAADALVSATGVQVGEDEEDLGFRARRDPALLTVKSVVGPVLALRGLGGEGERVGARAGFGESEGTEL